ncbi:MAG: hypothetical protein FJ263_05520 [Planctomycetes bacterium]|nr:hypothetical protein [Planctomycetota bacterium]
MKWRVYIAVMAGILLSSFSHSENRVPDAASQSTPFVSEKAPSVRQEFPIVYIDRSHEWLFAYDDLAERMLVPAGFDAVLFDASLGALASIHDYDVVFVLQTQCKAALSEAEEQLLFDYVTEGGQLILVTRPDMPAERLATRFGFTIIRGGKSPLRATQKMVSTGSPYKVPTRGVPFTLGKKKGQAVLVEDAMGQPAAAAVAIGKGRVVFWPDDGTYWDFTSQRDKNMKVASAGTTTAIFKWLVGNKRSTTPGRMARVFAENSKRNGSLIFRYSKPHEEAALRLMDSIPDILKVVRDNNGRGLPESKDFTVHFLSGGGGGWAGIHAIGVCAYGEDPAYPLKVFGHEFTHSTEGPLPWAFSEGWASIVGMRVAEKLGYAQSAHKELDEIITELGKIDPGFSKIDLMQMEKNRGDHIYQKKAVWLILELEKRYGRDFMSRFLDLRKKEYGERVEIDLKQTFALFAETSADKKIYSWLRSVGTSIDLPEKSS